jgi:CubicO group peptidase (beta-lactamase class C family)
VDFIQKRLLDPLGMKDSTFWPNEEQAQRLAYSYRHNADKTGLEANHFEKNLTKAAVEKFALGVPVPLPVVSNFGGGILPEYGNHYAQPAGGLFSTAEDVGKFCQMLLNGGVWQGNRLLSEKAIQQMSAIQTGDVMVNPNEGYGLGWFVKKKVDESVSVGSYGHRGARRTVMWIDPSHQLVIVLMVQCMDMTGAEQKALYGSVFQAAVDRYGKH